MLHPRGQAWDQSCPFSYTLYVGAECALSKFDNGTKLVGELIHQGVVLLPRGSLTS